MVYGDEMNVYRQMARDGLWCWRLYTALPPSGPRPGVSRPASSVAFADSIVSDRRLHDIEELDGRGMDT